MIQTIQSADIKGGFDWIEKSQANPLVKSPDPNDPNDPMSFSVLRQISMASDHQAVTRAFPKGIERNRPDQLDRLDQQMKSMTCNAGRLDRCSDQLDHTHAGLGGSLSGGGHRGARGAPAFSALRKNRKWTRRI